MTPEARTLLELALPNLRDYAVILINPDGVVVGWLCGAEDILGYTEAEAIGRPSGFIFVDEDLAQRLDEHELEIARRDSYAHDDRWQKRKDGMRIWVTGTVTALRDKTGLRGFIKILRDRTDQRMSAESTANRLAQLQDTAERTHQFMRTLGHELRNPLGPIKNAAALIAQVSEDPRLQKAVKAVTNQVTVLERIASDLVDVSRLQHPALELRLSSFDVRELVESETSGLKAAATARGLVLDAVLPDRPIELVADADRIRQALSNLLSNALKYTPAGGSIWVKVTREAAEVVVRVQDTGIGIAPETLPTIFELFTQEPRARALVPGGLGVGLGVVNQIAKLRDGVVQARSGGINKGAEFTLRLPSSGPARAAAVVRDEA